MKTCIRPFFVLLIILLPQGALAIDGLSPAVENGTINLSNWTFGSHGFIELNGNWVIYANKLLVSDLKLEGLDNPEGLIEVPQSFARFTLPSGKPLGSKAVATYRLDLLLPDQPTQLSVFLNRSESAHRLYQVTTDGKIVDLGGRGTPGSSSQRSVPGNLPFYTDFTASGKTMLLWEFSNYHHFHGGILQVPVLGSPPGVRNRSSLSVLYTILGAVLTVTLYSFTVFVFYRKESASFWLGLCGLVILFTVFFQHGLFLSLYDHLDGNRFFYGFCLKVRLIGTGLIPIVTLKFFSQLLRSIDIDIRQSRLSRRIHAGIYASSLAYVVLVSVLSTYLATLILDYFHLVLVISILWCVILMSWQWLRHKQPTILLSLIGFLVLAGTLVNDSLFSLSIIKTELYFHYGYLLFIITQGFVLAKNSAISRLKNEEYQATIEKQSQSLEQLNVNLEKTVEERSNQLKKAEAISSSLLESSPDKILAVDENLRVFYCNKLEPDQPEPIGQPVTKVLAPYSQPYVLKAIKRVLDNGYSDMIEVQADHCIPKQWHEYRFAGIKGDDNLIKEVMVIITNITKRKQAEKELKILQQELVQKAHKAGMGDIAADILHNVGNSLNSLKLSADLALSSIQSSQSINGIINANRFVKKTDDLEEFLKNDPRAVSLINYYLLIEKELNKDREKIEQNLEDVVSFVSDISRTILSQRDYVGLESIEDEVDLESMVEEALKMQTDVIIKNNITVRKSFHKAINGRVQKSKLMYVLINLIENAIDAMKSKPLEERLLKLSAEEDEQYAIIKVKDSGEGIVSDNLTKIFTHGFTTKTSGHGFGLHNCANYMSEMQASITVQSDGSGLGATFSLLFPKQ